MEDKEGTSEDLKYLINSFGDYQESDLENLCDIMIMRTYYFAICFRNIIMSFTKRFKCY